MSKFLIKSTEIYRVANEDEAKALIEEAKKDNSFVLTKYLSEKREQKQKGEIIDEWVRLTLVKSFNEEKEPNSIIDVNYEIEGFRHEPNED